MNRKRLSWLVATGLVALLIGWVTLAWPALTRASRVRQAREALMEQGIDARLLTHAHYSRNTVELEGPPRASDIVELSSDIAGLTYMAYLEPENGSLWWADELSGEGEFCIRTNIYK